MGTSLEVFFTSKYFRVPNYQRDFAWDVDNVDYLIDDIIDRDIFHGEPQVELASEQQQGFHQVFHVPGISLNAHQQLACGRQGSDAGHTVVHPHRKPVGTTDAIGARGCR